MEMLGHKTPEVFRRYSITDQRVLKEATEKLNRAAAKRLNAALCSRTTTQSQVPRGTEQVVTR